MSVTRLSERCPHLHTISLSGCDVTDTGIIKLAEGCPHLHTISLSGCDVTDTGIIKLAEGCPNLHKIYQVAKKSLILVLSSLQNNAFIYIPYTCPTLKSRI
jgi:hypothetical protein